MNKKLIMAVGPFFLALIIICGFFLVSKDPEVNEKTLKKAANSMNSNIIMGNRIKNAAAVSDEYILFCGSSELNRVDAFHPSVLAYKYERSYKPFLIGAAGTQSLTHYSMLSTMGETISGDKIVFVISPQWFIKKGVPSSFVNTFFSSFQTYKWLYDMEKVGEYEKYYASRLLELDFLDNDSKMCDYLKKISGGKLLNKNEKESCRFQMRILDKEDVIFGSFGYKSRHIEKRASELPDKYDLNELDRLAYKVGKESSDNNRFQIKNSFYNTRLRFMVPHMEGAQSNEDYIESPEFADFQLLLNEMAELDVDPLFIIPPVNGKWIEYTGLPEEMLKNFSRKITTQLADQGFNNILDLTDGYKEDYFMEDTIHIGWRGWVAVDRGVEPFLCRGVTNKTTYELDDYYLSDQWADKNF